MLQFTRPTFYYTETHSYLIHNIKTKVTVMHQNQLMANLCLEKLEILPCMNIKFLGQFIN